MDIAEYLDHKNIQYKLSGNEAICVCPECVKEKLYINISSGTYHCFYCEQINPHSLYAKGHISTLKEKWGDILPISTISIDVPKKEEIDFTKLVNRYHLNLLKSDKAIKYLEDRGISDESIRKFKLGLCEKYKQIWISIPSFEQGIPKLVKYRKLPPDTNKTIDKYIREKGGKSVLFNSNALDDNDEINICESELDAITLIQNGYDNTVSSTAGCGTLLPEWYDKLTLKNKLILIMDNDDDGQGQISARDVWATRLGFNRCYNVILPKGHDVNSFFQSHTADEFDHFLDKAQRFSIKGIISLQDALYEMYLKSTNKEETDAIPFPWKNVNKLMGGGTRKKRLCVLGGIPGCGKTSLAMQMCHYLSNEYKMPSLFYCMEMPEDSLATKIIQLENDLTVEEIDYSMGMYYAEQLEHIKMYFGCSSKVTPQIFYNTVEEARNRYGVEFVVFDNLQRMIRSGEESDIGAASAVFKDISMDLNVVMMLISQPRKLNNKNTITYDDLKGSSAIPADADEVILMLRKRMRGSESANSFSPETEIIIDKARFAPGGRTKLEFIGEKSKFIEFKR